jgi:hypothetical protein
MEIGETGLKGIVLMGIGGIVLTEIVPMGIGETGLKGTGLMATDLMGIGGIVPMGIGLKGTGLKATDLMATDLMATDLMATDLMATEGIVRMGIVRMGIVRMGIVLVREASAQKVEGLVPEDHVQVAMEVVEAQVVSVQVGTGLGMQQVVQARVVAAGKRGNRLSRPVVSRKSARKKSPIKIAI